MGEKERNRWERKRENDGREINVYIYGEYVPLEKERETLDNVLSQRQERDYLRCYALQQPTPISQLYSREKL